jgi:hypothetical protein
MQSGVASLSAGSSEPLAAAAQRVPSATGSGDEIDEFVILQGSVNHPELILPQFLTVGPPHLEDAALRIRATDHGAPYGDRAGAV